jgi:hypothetical protein
MGFSKGCACSKQPALPFRLPPFTLYLFYSIWQACTKGACRQDYIDYTEARTQTNKQTNAGQNAHSAAAIGNELLTKQINVRLLLSSLNVTSCSC